jgi:hypothetical protein
MYPTSERADTEGHTIIIFPTLPPDLLVVLRGSEIGIRFGEHSIPRYALYDAATHIPQTWWKGYRSVGIKVVFLGCPLRRLSTTFVRERKQAYPIHPT